MNRGGLWKSLFFLFVMVPMVWGTAVFAAERIVPSQYATIEDAINAADTGDVVRVADGTHAGNLLVQKAITIESENGAANCVIDGGGTASVVTFSGPAASGAVLKGFTITGGKATSGGGIYCWQASPTIMSCSIVRNEANIGGGVYLNRSSPTFVNCLIAENAASQYGGALYFFYQCAPDIIHCTVSRNTSALSGSALFCFSSAPVVTNSIIWGNIATSGPEINLLNTELDITYSVIDPSSGVSDDTNLYEDPVLVGEGDYHLSLDSPCIDAGTDQIELPEFDIEGDPRVVGDAPDMGADEFVAEEPQVLEVEIDIKPGCPNNKINLKSWGLLAVAVKTTEDFNAKDIDPGSVVFAGAKPFWRICYDVDRDSDKDMLFFFRVQKLVELNEDSTEATLAGETKDGKAFEGTDKVSIIKPKGKAKGW